MITPYQQFIAESFIIVMLQAYDEQIGWDNKDIKTGDADIDEFHTLIESGDIYITLPIPKGMATKDYLVLLRECLHLEYKHIAKEVEYDDKIEKAIDDLVDSLERPYNFHVDLEFGGE